VTETSPDRTHVVKITAFAGDEDMPLGRVELIGRGGEVLWRRDEIESGTMTVPIEGLSQRGYIIARAFGPADIRGYWRDVREVAISNPVYLHPRGQKFESPATTEVRVDIGESSPYVGGEIRFEDASGLVLLEGCVHAGKYRQTMPASGRITIRDVDGQGRTDYLVNANAKLLDLQRYLYRGRFLRDFPSLQPGECPPEAWQLDKYVEAMRAVDLKY
jgi:hypothetical protein